MSKIKTYILTKSYLIKAGVLSVINEIPEINFINFDYNYSITELTKHNTDALFIIDDYFYSQLNDKKKIKLIRISFEKNTSNNISIINNTKSEIVELITNFIQSEFNTNSNSKSNELSNREISIVKCIAKGMTNKEIADKLFISMHTVITHRKNITKKLGIKSISGITVYAILNNIVDINEI